MELVLYYVLSFCMFSTICLSWPLASTDVDNGINPEINFNQTLVKYNLTAFRGLLIQVKLFEKLMDTRVSYTVFAPTNEAIANAKSLLANATRLPEVMMYHIHAGSFKTSNIHSDMRLETLLGKQKKIRLERYNGLFYGSCQQFGKVLDWTYDSGLLNTMNGVMNPPEGNFYDILKATAAYSSFLSYVNTGGLQDLMNLQSPMTLLLPNNAAFAKLPTSVKEKMQSSYQFTRHVLQYHVVTEIVCASVFDTGTVPTYEGSNIEVNVSGNKVVFNGKAALIQADTIAYNGVIQVIDTVLLPPSDLV
ncbi:transforming growth factor-beta-induced protein ig-h3-like [Xenia sp. Carnegie-2017]|uniref:transforming growth factor-beta-induced protein ig-h3-like n=1 Tax=Xenia sp. Carnegie-2017 TaxID=2897299 RepID=UPI001F049243|nr:transforming growth factor-beta-induced protein ig-h3-like [Xenia sp. Carnegie-2017]